MTTREHCKKLMQVSIDSEINLPVHIIQLLLLNYHLYKLSVTLSVHSYLFVVD